MEIVPLLVQLISGAVGGNIAGGILKKLSLGTVGNSIVGILGGGLGGVLLSALGAHASGSGGVDMTSVLGSIAGGGVGGGVLLAIVGAIKNAMGKSA
jgi:uncharacterized membrane protein YeaQ/YmgE (transglycosylase-associated protein family)